VLSLTANMEAGSETQSKSPDTSTSSNPAVSEANRASKTTQPRKVAVPDILIVVTKPTQTMTVTVDSHVRYRWPVSTGATHFSTPDGSYTPTRKKALSLTANTENFTL
jgi:hypothetical protein